MSGQQVIKRAAEAVDIGPGIDIVAVLGLFRGKVVGGTENVFVVRDGERGSFVVGEEGEPHIEDFDYAFFVDEQIGGFNITMDEAVGMGVVESFGRLREVICGQVEIERAHFLDEVLEVFSFDVLHDDVMLIAFIADIVCVNDVRMIEGGGGTGLEIKTIEIGGIVDAILGEDFECPQLAHVLVFGEIDVAHAAASEERQQAIVAEIKAFVLAAFDLFGLPAREDVFLDEGIDEFVGIFEGDAAAPLLDVGNDALDAIWRSKPAFGEYFKKLFDRHLGHELRQLRSYSDQPNNGKRINQGEIRWTRRAKGEAMQGKELPPWARAIGGESFALRIPPLFNIPSKV